MLDQVRVAKGFGDSVNEAVRVADLLHVNMSNERISYDIVSSNLFGKPRLDSNHG